MQTKNSISLIKKQLYGILLLAIFLFAFNTGNFSTVQAQKLAAETPSTVIFSLHTDKATFGITEGVALHMTITNVSDHPIRMPRWITALDGVEGSLFIVTRDGMPVNYTGRIVKRPAPTEQDYITLTAGESVSSDVELSAYYDFSISGKYAVAYDLALWESLTNNNNGQMQKNAGGATSNTLELFVEGRTVRIPHELRILTVNGSTAFNSCSVSQQTELINSRNAASLYASNAVMYFGANKQDAAYSTWFGVYNASRYSTASSHFTAISNAMDNANPMTFDCTCTDPSYYAYVYPTQPYTIYLCGAFWGAPTTGTDSKAGTLIHETSHFNVVAGTVDYVYGQTAAQNLAISNPDNAMMNADNHEYFAENVPPPYNNISGNTGVAGVTLAYTEYGPKSVQADGSGNYTITVSSGWMGTVTPKKIGYQFTPANKSYSNVQTNQTAQNYTASVCASCADKDTVGVFRPSNGALYLRNLNVTGFADVAINYGLAGDYPIVGDWDGNGTDTIGVYRNGVFYLRNSNSVGVADKTVVFGSPGDQPIAGDWDGNGTETIGVYRSSTGTFLLRNSLTSGPADVTFVLGNPGDVGIAGDWNGDGTTSTGVFRPSNGVIFLKNTNTPGFADIALNSGLPGDQPVVGDWDNNGTTTIGVYRNARFYLRNSNTNGFANIQLDLGNVGDVPIGGNWDAKP